MVKAWREKVVIPTYEVGKPEKNPIFLEKRVYQGSSGVVYPYPVIESMSDEKVDKEYEAIFIENEYIKVMILPELGGRVQMAYDKIRERHFIYYNHVIKPALVGLAGPWISGGIEFNWPQHHRPSTSSERDGGLHASSGTCFSRNKRGALQPYRSAANLLVVGESCRSGERLLSECISARHQCGVRSWEACRIQLPYSNGYLL